MTGAARRQGLALLTLGLKLGLGMGMGLLAGCGGEPSPSVWLRSVAFQVAADANDDAPVAVDLVRVGRQDIVETIGHLTAAEWFQRKAQFDHDYPEALAVTGWELVPGQGVPDQKLPPFRDAWAAYFFAAYAGPGAHRAAVTNRHDVRVTLGRDDLTVTPLN